LARDRRPIRLKKERKERREEEDPDVLLAHGEGKEGGLVAGEKVVAALLKVPAFVLEDALEASLLKVARELGCGVFSVSGERRAREGNKEGTTHRRRGREKGSD